MTRIAARVCVSGQRGMDMARRLVVVMLLVSTTLVGATATASAAPKTGCAAGGWQELSVADAANLIFPGLIDPDAVGGSPAALAVLLDGYDVNNDDFICLKVLAGEQLNPNSHWYRVGMEVLGFPAPLFIFVDNPANASNK